MNPRNGLSGAYGHWDMVWESDLFLGLLPVIIWIVHGTGGIKCTTERIILGSSSIGQQDVGTISTGGDSSKPDSYDWNVGDLARCFCCM
jgi:hypothetical protein